MIITPRNLNEEIVRIKSLFTEERLYGNLVEQSSNVLDTVKGSFESVGCDAAHNFSPMVDKVSKGLTQAYDSGINPKVTNITASINKKENETNKYITNYSADIIDNGEGVAWTGFHSVGSCGGGYKERADKQRSGKWDDDDTTKITVGDLAGQLKKGTTWEQRMKNDPSLKAGEFEDVKVIENPNIPFRQYFMQFTKEGKPTHISDVDQSDVDQSDVDKKEEIINQESIDILKKYGVNDDVIKKLERHPDNKSWYYYDIEVDNKNVVSYVSISDDGYFEIEVGKGFVSPASGFWEGEQIWGYDDGDFKAHTKGTFIGEHLYSGTFETDDGGRFNNKYNDELSYTIENGFLIDGDKKIDIFSDDYNGKFKNEDDYEEIKKEVVKLRGGGVETELEEEKTGCVEGDCENGQGAYIYDSGDKYVGEWKDGKWHGQGTFTWSDGTIYSGEWKDDLQHGQGTFIYGKGEYEGEKYEGEWEDGEYNGKGIYTWTDGSNISGEWRDGKEWDGWYTDEDGRKTQIVAGEEVGEEVEDETQYTQGPGVKRNLAKGKWVRFFGGQMKIKQLAPGVFEIKSNMTGNLFCSNNTWCNAGEKELIKKELTGTGKTNNFNLKDPPYSSIDDIEVLDGYKDKQGKIRVKGELKY